MKAYKLYKQLVVGNNSDGYETYKEKILGYYLNKETAESHKELYIKWNTAKNVYVFIEEIEINEERTTVNGLDFAANPYNSLTYGQIVEVSGKQDKEESIDNVFNKIKKLIETGYCASASNVFREYCKEK